MNKQENQAFAAWLEKCGLRKSTIKTYPCLLNPIRSSISLKNDDELIIIGTLNEALRVHGKKIRAPIRKYIKFKFEQETEAIEDMREKELMRIKKNKILSNVELMESRKHRDMLTKDDIPNRYIPPEDLYKILMGMDLKTKTILLITYDLAARINEVLGNYTINFKPTGLNIPRELAKSTKSRFVPYMMPETYAVLQQYIAKFGPAGPPEKMFKGTTYMQVYYLMKKQAKKIGFRLERMSLGNLSEISPHWLRHTRATQLAQTWELGKLQRHLGHGDPKMTNVYIDYTRDTKVETLEHYMKKNKLKLI